MLIASPDMLSSKSFNPSASTLIDDLTHAHERARFLAIH